MRWVAPGDGSFSRPANLGAAGWAPKWSSQEGHVRDGDCSTLARMRPAELCLAGLHRCRVASSTPTRAHTQMCARAPALARTHPRLADPRPSAYPCQTPRGGRPATRSSPAHSTIAVSAGYTFGTWAEDGVDRPACAGAFTAWPAAAAREGLAHTPLIVCSTIESVEQGSGGGTA